MYAPKKLKKLYISLQLQLYGQNIKCYQKSVMYIQGGIKHKKIIKNK